MDEFAFSALVCINTLIRRRNSGRECALVIELTKRVLRNNADDDSDEHENGDNFLRLIPEFNTIAEKIREEYRDESEKFNNAEDVTNWVLKYIHTFVQSTLGVDIALVEIKTKKTNEYKVPGWQTIEAPWVWTWIHVTTILLDLNSGSNEKVHYINFIAHLIGCTMCLSHYVHNKVVLLANLSEYSLTDLFLQLHSHISQEKKRNPSKNDSLLMLNKSLINIKYKHKFQKMIFNYT